MTISAGVVWKEGLSLLPQHFQVQEDFFHHIMAESVRTHIPDYWGFEDYRIDVALLSSGKLRVISGKGYFKDGTPFDLSASGPPDAISLPPTSRPTTIYLGLAIDATLHSAQTGEGSHHARYKEEYHEVSDSFSAHPSTEKIPLKAQNCQLLTQKDDLSGFHAIPIAVAAFNSDSGAIVLRDAFVPPVLNYKISGFIKNIVAEMLAALEKKGHALSQILSNDTLESRISWEEIFYLRSINKALAKLREFQQNPRSYHPNQVFLTLKETVADLATICEPSRIVPHLAYYDHDDICDSFTSLVIKAREYLRKVIIQKVYRFPLEKENLGYWTCSISNDIFFTEYDLYIEVQQKRESRQLSQNIDSLLRASNLDEIDHLRRTNARGLALEYIPTPPLYLPAKALAKYFKISPSAEDKKKLIASSGLGIHFASHLDEVDINLFAIKL